MITKKDIETKFKDVSHKWVTINFEEEVFQEIKAAIIEAKKFNEDKKVSEDFLHLAKCFKKNDFAFVKFTKFVGTKKSFVCKCELITQNNYKKEINIQPAVLNSLPILDGTPKSNKLYKLERAKRNSNWKKPNDGFCDEIEIPLDYELTEDGYYLYKGYYEEQQKNEIKKERNWQQIPSKFRSMLS